MDAIGRNFIHIKVDMTEEEEKNLAESKKTATTAATSKNDEAGHTKLGIEVKKD